MPNVSLQIAEETNPYTILFYPLQRTVNSRIGLYSISARIYFTLVTTLEIQLKPAKNPVQKHKEAWKKFVCQIMHLPFYFANF